MMMFRERGIFVLWISIASFFVLVAAEEEECSWIGFPTGDDTRPCWCPIGSGGLNCELMCDYVSEGPDCKEWPVGTPICRNNCDEKGQIVDKTYTAETTVVYTIEWSTSTEEITAIDLQNDQLDEYVDMYNEKQCIDLDCQNNGVCQYGVSYNYDYGNNNNGNSHNNNSDGSEGEDKDEYFNPDSIIVYHFCQCDENYLGEQCETERECELSCENGGDCQFWYRKRALEDGGDDVWADDDFYQHWDQYCTCPEAFCGRNCQWDCEEDCTMDCNNGSCQFYDQKYRRLEQEEEIEEEDEYREKDMHCVCDDGYYGRDCQFEYGVCELDCENGGECQFWFRARALDEGWDDDNENEWEYDDDYYQYSNQYCTCPDGYCGRTCQYDCVQDCDMGCENGSCFFYQEGEEPHDHEEDDGKDHGTIGQDGMYCVCDNGFYGYLCENDYGDCELGCENGGECQFYYRERSLEDWDNEQYWNQYCSCPEGWCGRLCQFDCEQDCGLECFNGGSCYFVNHYRRELEQDYDGGEKDEEFQEFYCTCPNGYYGYQCETSYGDCAEECQNGGECSQDVWGYGYCDCAGEWVGKVCEEPCPCENGGECLSWQQISYNDDDAGDDRFFNEDNYNNNNGNNYNAEKEEEYQELLFGSVCICPSGFEGTLCQDGESDDSPDCEMPCQNGGVCMSGVVSEVRNGNNRALDDPDNWSNQYCECPGGYSGLFCERQECGTTYCENGGACVELPTTGNFVCDCSAGETNDQYAAGSHCQYTASAMCDIEEQSPNGPWFCANEGSCQGPSSGPSCSCPTGWGGPRCEYNLSDAEDAALLECSLACANDGSCLKGIKPVADIFLPFLDKTANSGLLQYNPTDSFEYCQCPIGFLGVTCEKQYELCGDEGDHICFHGSTCMSAKGGKEWKCDCTGLSAAGLYCQHEATSICEEGDPLAFCTNGGTCSDTKNEVCDCPDDFSGTHCEIEYATPVGNDDGDLRRSGGTALYDISLSLWSSAIVIAALFLLH